MLHTNRGTGSTTAWGLDVFPPLREQWIPNHNSYYRRVSSSGSAEQNSWYIKKINKVHVLEWLSKSCDPKRIQMLWHDLKQAVQDVPEILMNSNLFCRENHLKLFQGSVQTSTGDILCCGWCWWSAASHLIEEMTLSSQRWVITACSVKTWKVYCCVPILDGVCL